ncbi:MAG: glycine cleavage system protein H [Gammaproteobacteria bacterium]|nr:glycine cleavage system protein H [Gammaproteobacteria bacterium]|tara:strand:+ start:404 stop:799 length:396 start_codon:yes stop_codon:yes gene_type:complete
MNKIPGDLLFTKDHEWLRQENDGLLTVGITDHAQDALGDLVYVELPVVGQDVIEAGEIAVVESVKAASDVYSPVAGRVEEINQSLADIPENINSDPYGDGWIARIKPTDQIVDNNFMSPDEYEQYIHNLGD